jgi:hypothetical protein
MRDRSCSETLPAGSNLEYTIYFKFTQNTWIDIIDIIFDTTPQKIILMVTDLMSGGGHGPFKPRHSVNKSDTSAINACEVCVFAPSC